MNFDEKKLIKNHLKIIRHFLSKTGDIFRATLKNAKNINMRNYSKL